MPVYQQNGRWYFKIQIRNRRYNRAVPEANCKRDAEKAEAVFKSELLQGRFNLAENKGEMLFKKLSTEYQEYSRSNKLSWKSDLSRIKHLEVFFGSKKLNEISPIMIELYRRERKKFKKKDNTNLTPATINRETEILRKMFNIAIDNGWIDDNPCSSRKVKKLREDTKKERFLSRQEEERLLNECQGIFEYMRPIIIFALNTGMRKSEILNLKWDYVDLKKKFITVTKTKSGKDRKIPINSILYKELKTLNDSKISDFVFANPSTDNPYYDLKRSFKTLTKNAKIEGLVFHDLRHTAATRMVANGVDLIVVQDILGHASITTTMRYSHPVPDRKLKAMEALVNFQEDENNVITLNG